MFRTGFLSIIRSLVLYTVQQVYVKQVVLTACEQDQGGTDDGQKTCPKHVEFYSKNKFEKLVHLVGLIIRKFISSLFFFLGTRWSLVKFRQRPLQPWWRSCHYGLNKRLSDPQSLQNIFWTVLIASHGARITVSLLSSPQPFHYRNCYPCFYR